MIKDLEATIGYHFHNIGLLQNALTHSSYANERWHNGILSNERLEFLGDAILDMVTAEYLFRQFPDRPEGELTRMRADMVCEKTLAKIAHEIHLGDYLMLGNGEDQCGGRTRDSVLADAVESVIAACYMDGGMQIARDFISRYVLTEVPVTRMHNVDYKTGLQELIQRDRSKVLTYALVGQSGPDHEKTFTVEAYVNGEVVGVGTGTSKKRAEQDAARAAMESLFPGKN